MYKVTVVIDFKKWGSGPIYTEENVWLLSKDKILEAIGITLYDDQYEKVIFVVKKVEVIE